MLAAVILALSASAPARAAETVRIAVAAPLTGDLAPDGQSIRRAVDLAVAEANASKAFPFAIEALALDDRADPKEAVNVANLISADGRVVAVVGHVNSGCCLPASRVYAKAGIPMLTPTGISGEITSQQLAPGWSWPRLVLRLPPRDDVQGAASARFCLERLKARRVAIIQDQTPYGQGLARAFRAALEAGGGSVASEDAVSVGDRDFKALAARLAEEKPQAVYFGGLYTEFGLFLRQARALGLAAEFLSASGSFTPSLFRVAGSAADGAYLAASGLPPEKIGGYPAFLRRLRARYPGVEPTPFDHYGYAAAQVVLSALKTAGPDRAKLLGAMRSGRHETILGTVEFDELGDSRDQRVTMMRAAAGRLFKAVQ